MAGVPGRSGGQNRLPVEAHLLRGSFRADRHGHLLAPPPEPTPVEDRDRRRVVAGLTGSSRRMALRLLDQFTGWNASKLETLKLYAESHARLEALRAAGGDDPSRAIQREVRCNLALLKMLNLEQ